MADFTDQLQSKNVSIIIGIIYVTESSRHLDILVDTRSNSWRGLVSRLKTHWIVFLITGDVYMAPR